MGSPISGNPRSRQGWFVNANSLVGAPSDGYAVAVEDGEVRGWGALNGRCFNSGVFKWLRSRVIVVRIWFISLGYLINLMVDHEVNN